MARLAPSAVALLILSCASAPRPLSEALPAGLPTAAVRAAWERIDGDYETPTAHVRYSLFVDPKLPLLYRLTQYRVSPRVTAAKGGTRLEEGSETVIWNETPGRRGPLRCFVEQRPPDPSTSTRGVRTSWRDVRPESDEFRTFMLRAIEIYFQARSAGRGGPPAG